MQSFLKIAFLNLSRSPSGNGLKIIVKVKSTKEEHKEMILAIQDHYEKLLNLEIDKSGKDITRLCFYSSDENLYLNENAKTFENITNQIEISPPSEGCPQDGVAKNSQCKTENQQPTTAKQSTTTA